MEGERTVTYMVLCGSYQNRTWDIAKGRRVPFSDLWMIPQDACGLALDMNTMDGVCKWYKSFPERYET